MTVRRCSRTGYTEPQFAEQPRGQLRAGGGIQPFAAGHVEPGQGRFDQAASQSVAAVLGAHEHAVKDAQVVSLADAGTGQHVSAVGDDRKGVLAAGYTLCKPRFEVFLPEGFVVQRQGHHCRPMSRCRWNDQQGLHVFLT